ncbi:hypothetical protein B9Z65_1413 [Elsinoe australis]|uniref:Uncharacterized protein n=1 Tax=Elsinoe australis TaxID=40998 RepID=A0A2P7YFT4_9PEZI|nr:hypothetical protein B9Z65_1413 [Elsinoe australis]QLL26888.1 hypothetical protein [Elsinoe australis]
MAEQLQDVDKIAKATGIVVKVQLRRKAVSDSLADVLWSCIVRYTKMDRKIIMEQLREILEGIKEILEHQDIFFASAADFSQYFTQVAIFLDGITTLIHIHHQHLEYLAILTKGILNQHRRRTERRLEENVEPWSQFTNPGAPAIPGLATQKPIAPPAQRSMAKEYKHMYATAVQSLPHGATVVGEAYATEFEIMLRYLRVKYPNHLPFHTNLAPRMLEGEYDLLDNVGLQHEERRVLTSPNAISLASRSGAELGRHDRTNRAKTLGRIARSGSGIQTVRVIGYYRILLWKFTQDVKETPKEASSEELSSDR